MGVIDDNQEVWYSVNSIQQHGLHGHGPFKFKKGDPDKGGPFLEKDGITVPIANLAGEGLTFWVKE